MRRIGFHTPELPAPLGLDLATLDGGGSCPSQFEGKTHDGLDVYVRYRGGTLRIYVGDKPGVEAFRDGTCILEADIGPPFDGSMSLTQFCTNFGVTINGDIPAETDPDAHRYKDLSGRTTFWYADLSKITIDTARKIISEAWSSLPNALLVKPIISKEYKLERLEPTTPERIDTSYVWLIDGPSLMTEIDTSPKEYILPKADQLQISIHFSSWQYPSPMYTSRLSQAVEELGRTFFVPGERNMPKELELTTDSLSLGARFPKEDQGKRDALTRLGKTISQQLPVTTLERVDLATGNSIDRFDTPLDPVIVNWCNSGVDRWVAIDRENRNAPWIGLRPANP